MNNLLTGLWAGAVAATSLYLTSLLLESVVAQPVDRLLQSLLGGVGLAVVVWWLETLEGAEK